MTVGITTVFMDTQKHIHTCAHVCMKVGEAEEMNRVRGRGITARWGDNSKA